MTTNKRYSDRFHLQHLPYPTARTSPRQSMHCHRAFSLHNKCLRMLLTPSLQRRRALFCNNRCILAVRVLLQSPIADSFLPEEAFIARICTTPKPSCQLLFAVGYYLFRSNPCIAAVLLFRATLLHGAPPPQQPLYPRCARSPSVAGRRQLPPGGSLYDSRTAVGA